MDVSIYILQLQQGKYYVGKSSRSGVKKRLEDHFNHRGSAWTEKYPPVRVVKILDGCDNFDEDKYTLKYMNECGIENVRGGAFCQVELDETQKEQINRMLKGAADRCYNCGEQGHFVGKCPVKQELEDDINDFELMNIQDVKQRSTTLWNVGL